ncbi:MAG: right-handed parallel beta-helix repeat-containing protein [Desulfobacterales bacterium]|nr:right-handed parallel beta-helix repeat-containing protein [Desulfobacterales bacterium]
MERLFNIHIEKLPEGVYLATSESVQGLVAHKNQIKQYLCLLLISMIFLTLTSCKLISLAVHPIEIPGYPNVISQNTTWKKFFSPYKIKENLFILPDVTLTIEPGVEVILGPYVKIKCQGQIIAQGTSEKPIWIHPAQGQYWDTIDCFAGKPEENGKLMNNVFKHCIIEGGRSLSIISSAAIIESCVFKNNVSSPIRIEYAEAQIKSNEIFKNSTEIEATSGNSAGITVYSDKQVIIENNHIHDNISVGGKDGGGGIYAFAYNNGKVTIQNNHIHHNKSDRHGGGIVAYECRVNNNHIHDNFALDSGGGVYSIRSQIENNTIEANHAKRGGGGYSELGVVSHNLFVKNSSESDQGDGLYMYGSGNVEYNTFVDNTSKKPTAGATIMVSGNPVLNHNNVISKTKYALKIQTHTLSPDLNASNNYWGTTDNLSMIQLVYDWLDNSELGLVTLEPYLSAWEERAPSVPDKEKLRSTILTMQKPDDSFMGIISKSLTLGDEHGRLYTIEGNVFIPENVRVTLLPGTRLYLNPNVTLRIRGALLALGTEKNPIYFTGDHKNPWGQICFETIFQPEKQSANTASIQSAFQHCVVEFGHGILMEGKGPDIYHCIIRNNHNSGLTIRNISVNVAYNKIYENQSPSNGGGIYAYSNELISITNNQIWSNQAKENGGGVFAYGYRSNTAINLSDNLIQTNQANGDGGGVWASRSSLKNNTIYTNQAQGKGGGLFITFGLAEKNKIECNRSNTGGGIFAETNSSFEHNIITKNQADHTGGVYLNFWGMSIKNEMFRHNIVTVNRSLNRDDPVKIGGIYVSGSLVFEYNGIYDNSDVQIYNANPVNIEPLLAQNCYWAAYDEASINNLIWDGNDDPKLSKIEYKPFAVFKKSLSIGKKSKTDSQQKQKSTLQKSKTQKGEKKKVEKKKSKKTKPTKKSQKVKSSKNKKK